MPHPIEATSLRDCLCASVSADMIGTRVTVCGWVARRREHGEHLAFLDLRDRSGLVQAVARSMSGSRPAWWSSPTARSRS